MSFIRKFIEQEKINRRDLLLASAFGLGGVAAASLLGPRIARAAIADPTVAWSYRNRTNPYWNEIVSGGEAFVQSLGKPKEFLTHLINEGSSEKSLADVKALLAKTDGNPQAVELVARGEILATVFTNPHWGGGVTASLAWHAAIGAFRPSEEPPEHREFYGPSIMVTPQDALDFKNRYLDNVPTYDWTDFWGPSNGRIMYK